MSESGEKTELPTPKKERDAREKGQVAKSQEVVITSTLFAVIAYVWVMAPSIIAQLVEALKIPTYRDGEFEFAAFGRIQEIFDLLIIILLPILGLVIFVAIASNMGQFGFLMSADQITPKGEKISPLAGVKRIFSIKQLIETLKNILKIAILSTLLFFALKNNLVELLDLVYCGMGCVGQVTNLLLGDIFRYSAIAFIVIAGFDFMYQRHTHTKSLMMTKDEVKREYKESEGDPHIKGERRQIAQELAMGDGGAVKKATAVVVNPTHYAVAILYEKGKTPLPITTAKGVDGRAALMRGEAEAAGVPIFRSPLLARRLFVDAEINEPIPIELFEAVAEIFVWVERNRGELYGGRPLNHGVIDLDWSPTNGTKKLNIDHFKWPDDLNSNR
jgi:type III secretion protein U